MNPGRLLCLLCLVFFLPACSTDVELEGEWKDIPVVYGFLSRQDTAHYLRIEKAFLPRGGDANRAAQIADSLYYAGAVVQLEKVSSGKTFQLLRVDGNREGYPRQAGPFAQAPNYLYKIKASDIQLAEGERIRLLLNRGDQLPLVTAETTVLGELQPRPTSPNSPVNMGYDRSVSIAWFAGPDARLFDVRLRIHYRESVPGAPTQLQPKTVDWVLADRLEREDEQERVSLTIQGEEFYRFLKEQLLQDGRIIRVFDSMDLLLTAGGQEFVDLLRVSEANLGITSFQAVPVYSNISEGQGIFSSRAYANRTGLLLDNISLDSLRNGIYTRDLNFQ